MRHVQRAARFLFGFGMLAAACAQAPLPPGPETPAENLRQYDRFVDRVEREALLASWEPHFYPGRFVETRLIGAKPVILLTESERDVWRSQLRSEQDVRVIEAIADKAIQTQSAAFRKRCVCCSRSGRSMES